MVNNRFKTVKRVVESRLCMGCGACLSVCEDKNISLINVPDQGLRPRVDVANCKECGECVAVCAGVNVTHQRFHNETIRELRLSWGPVLEVWEGYATDSEIHFKGSSGGLATVLALFCLEKEHMSGVLHIGAKPEAPLENVPVFSKTKKELLACTGSRYSPAAPCEKIGWIQEASSTCVFIGKPCDVEALRNLQEVKPELKEKVGLLISIFCAGTPSSQGTKVLLDTLGVEADNVAELRYRGCGWPGMASVKHRDNRRLYQLTYEEAWGNILSRYVPLRCRFCSDGTGEFADISCGDPWYKKIEPDDPGRSLVLIRTERGRKFLHKALELDYVRLVKVDSKAVPLSQRSLLDKRRNLWGRLLAMRIMGIYTPQYHGFSLFRNWCKLPMAEQIRSVVGTFYRIISRRLSKPLSHHFE